MAQLTGQFTTAIFEQAAFRAFVRFAAIEDCCSHRHCRDIQ
jgi:hypothetical protein